MCLPHTALLTSQRSPHGHLRSHYFQNSVRQISHIHVQKGWKVGASFKWCCVLYGRCGWHIILRSYFGLWEPSSLWIRHGLGSQIVILTNVINWVEPIHVYLVPFIWWSFTSRQSLFSHQRLQWRRDRTFLPTVVARENRIAALCFIHAETGTHQRGSICVKRQVVASNRHLRHLMAL